MARQRQSRQLRQAYSHVSYMKSHKGKTIVKLSELVLPALSQALQSLGHKEVDMKLAWSITKLMEERHAHIKTLEEARKVLLDKYCEKDEAGAYKTNEDKTQYMIIDEAAYQAAYEELTDIEVEVTMLEKSSLDKLVSITPAQLLSLKPFLV